MSGRLHSWASLTAGIPERRSGEGFSSCPGIIGLVVASHQNLHQYTPFLSVARPLCSSRRGTIRSIKIPENHQPRRKISVSRDLVGE